MKNPSRTSRIFKTRWPFSQTGSSLVEVMGALAIGAGVMAGIADQTDRYLDNTRAVKAAEYHRAASQAALQYFKSIQTNPSKLPAANVINVVPWSDIQSTVSSAKNLAETNPYLEKTCVLLRNDNGTLRGLMIVGGEASTGAPEIIQRRAMVAGLAGLAVGLRKGGALQGSNWKDDQAATTWQLAAKGCDASPKGKLPEGGLATDLQLLDLLGSMPQGGGGDTYDHDILLHRTYQTERKLNAMETTLTMSGTAQRPANIDMNGWNLLNAGTITLSGTVRRIEKLLGINILSKETVQFGGGVAATSATLSGELQAASANVSGNVQAASANITGNVQAGSANLLGNLYMQGPNNEIRGVEKITGSNQTFMTFNATSEVVQINAGLQADEYLKINKTKKKNDQCALSERYRYVRDENSSGLLYCDGKNWVSTQEPAQPLKARYVDSGEQAQGYDYLTVFCAPGEIAISGGGTSYGSNYSEFIKADGNKITYCRPGDPDIDRKVCHGIRPGIDGGHPVWDRIKKRMGWAISGTLPGREDRPAPGREEGNKLRVYAICVQGDASYVPSRADADFDAKGNMTGW